MGDDDFWIRQAESLAERMDEAETQAERKLYEEQYKQIMCRVMGNPNLFRKKPSKTNKPSRHMRRTLKPCKKCGETKITWCRKIFEYEYKCGHDQRIQSIKHKDGKEFSKCYHCGEDSGWQEVGPLVKFSCQCGYETGFHKTNSLARDEWNDMPTEKGNGLWPIKNT